MTNNSFSREAAVQEGSVINLRAGKNIKRPVVSVVKISCYRYDKIIINSSDMREMSARSGPAPAINYPKSP